MGEPGFGCGEDPFGGEADPAIRLCGGEPLFTGDEAFATDEALFANAPFAVDETTSAHDPQLADELACGAWFTLLALLTSFCSFTEASQERAEEEGEEEEEEEDEGEEEEEEVGDRARSMPSYACLSSW